MKKILTLLPILFALFSCENKDIIIQKSAGNCSCNAILENAYNEAVDKYMQTHKSCGVRSFSDCSNPFYFDKPNKKQYSITNTIELKNKSQTKVYDVVIQIDRNGSITYENFTIQPTESKNIGCDYDFNAEFYDSYNEPEFSDIRLSNFSKISYKIHKVTLISEY